MELVPIRDPSLPPLAWCARVARGAEQVELLCGASVEVRDGAFFEGAWAGPFPAMGFDESASVFGSGGTARGRQTTFVTPSNLCERLHVLPCQDELFVSNSLCFALAAAGDRLDPHHAGYAAAFSDIMGGLPRFTTTIPTAAGQRLRLVYFNNFTVSSELALGYAEKPEDESFDDFAGYESLLESTVRAALQNAADPARRSSYAPLATVSSGYDSPACAALAKRLGCRRAVTLIEARGPDNRSEGEDSGTAVAEALGMTSSEFSRLAYLEKGGCPEAEFLATGMTGEDVIFLPFERELEQAVFLTGAYGDAVWDKHAQPTEVIRRRDLSMSSMTEFRLRVDFIHLPVPLIGARKHPQIKRVSNSPEMEPFSVGGDFDRPIARRIAEQEGVPRELFGQSKKATSTLLHLYGLDAMSPGTRRALTRFVRELDSPPSARLRFRLDALLHRLGDSLQVRLKQAGLLRLVPPLAERPFQVHSHTPLGPLPVIWAMDEIMRTRYPDVAARWAARAHAGVS